MKTFLLILSTALFISCDKDNCQSCTRTWTYKSYTQYANGNISSVTQSDGGTEKFSACGDDMIEAEEKTQTTYSKVLVPSYTNRWSVAEGTGTCDCN